MDKTEFNKMVEECGADPEELLARISSDAFELEEVQKWMQEVEDAWEEAARQERDYSIYCANHRF